MLANPHNQSLLGWFKLVQFDEWNGGKPAGFIRNRITMRIAFRKAQKLIQAFYQVRRLNMLQLFRNVMNFIPFEV
ncbi:hypothetical protein D3C86_1956250 [compost metagenome]